MRRDKNREKLISKEKVGIDRFLVWMMLIAFLISSAPSLATAGELKVIKSIDLPGKCCSGLAWDGSYLWSADYKSRKIYKIDPKNGDVIKRLTTPGEWPAGLAWDGRHLWSADYKSRKIYKIDPKNGEVIKSINLPGKCCSGLAWDGSHLWSADICAYSATIFEIGAGAKIYKIDPKNGEVIKSIKSAHTSPRGLAWDGSYLWYIDEYMYWERIYKVDPANGNVIKKFTPPGKGPSRLAWDGSYLWNSDESRKIYKINVQGLPNVCDAKFRQAANKVIIEYDLKGIQNSYYVFLKCSDDGGKNFNIIPKTISGDVGKNIKPGKNKKIVWDALKDFPKGLHGDQFVFSIIAE